MDKLIVALEPKGYYELEVSHMLDPDSEWVRYLLVTGDKAVPVPDDDQIELLIYQAHGCEIRDVLELSEYLENNKWIEYSLDEYTDRAIEWYEQRGFTAERIGLAMISGLN